MWFIIIRGTSQQLVCMTRGEVKQPPVRKIKGSPLEKKAPGESGPEALMMMIDVGIAETPPTSPEN